jgi:hypothetical protein
LVPAGNGPILTPNKGLKVPPVVLPMVRVISDRAKGICVVGSGAAGASVGEGMIGPEGAGVGDGDAAGTFIDGERTGLAGIEQQIALSIKIAMIG